MAAMHHRIRGTAAILPWMTFAPLRVPYQCVLSTPCWSGTKALPAALHNEHTSVQPSCGGRVFRSIRINAKLSSPIRR
jgi:hypothetical protein